MRVGARVTMVVAREALEREEGVAKRIAGESVRQLRVMVALDGAWLLRHFVSSWLMSLSI
jgi:hypothetical protein